MPSMALGNDLLKQKFAHPHVVPNLYEFLSSVEHKILYFEEYG